MHTVFQKATVRLHSGVTPHTDFLVLVNLPLKRLLAIILVIQFVLFTKQDPVFFKQN